MNRLFYFIIYLLITSSLLHSASPRIINDQTIHLIKTELEKELATVKEADKKFHLYNMAANEFMSYQYYKEAKDYFHKAIELNTNIDKSFTYINLLSVNQTLGDKKEILKTYNESKSYFEKIKTLIEMKQYPLALEQFKKTNIAKMKDGKLQVTYMPIYCKILKEKKKSD